MKCPPKSDMLTSSGVLVFLLMQDRNRRCTDSQNVGTTTPIDVSSLSFVMVHHLCSDKGFVIFLLFQIYKSV